MDVRRRGRFGFSRLEHAMAMNRAGAAKLGREMLEILKAGRYRNPAGTTETTRPSFSRPAISTLWPFGSQIYYSDKQHKGNEVGGSA